jgi:branched-chain amino acid transport system permease protein
MISLGVPTLRYKVGAFVISGVFTGLAGVLLAVSQNFVSPVDLSWVRSADLVIIAVLGGSATVWGPVLGSLTFFSAELVLSSWTIYWNLWLGVLVIVVAAFLPDGIAGVAGKLLRRWRCDA